MNIYALYDNSVEQSVWHDNDADDYGEVDDDDTAATSWAIKKSFLLCNFFWDSKEFLPSVSLYRREVKEYTNVYSRQPSTALYTPDYDALYKYEILLCAIYF